MEVALTSSSPIGSPTQLPRTFVRLRVAATWWLQLGVIFHFPYIPGIENVWEDVSFFLAPGHKQIQGKEKDIQKDSRVVFTSNNTSVHEVFDRCIKVWDSLYRSRAYVHVYEQDGISVHDLVESRNIVNYISDAYKEFARWEDKFFEQDGGGGYNKPVIRDRAVENDEQLTIAEELKKLWEGEMYIEQVSHRR